MATFFSEGADIPLELSRDSFELLSLNRQEYARVDDMLFPVRRKSGVNIFAFTGSKWPGGELVFEFDASVSEAWRVQFRRACREWSTVAKVKFTQRGSQRAFVFVKNGSTNSSVVGYMGRRQELTITSWHNHIVIAHELGHALGLSHEQCRSDRDTYVAIHRSNIPQQWQHNFVKYPRSINYSEYDFGSIMHYDRNAFAKDRTKPTISAKPAYKQFEGLMGNHAKLSVRDKTDMAAHYGSL